MNAAYTIKHWLKRLRWRYRRWEAARRWGVETLRKSPVVLGNAMPKSGSHLVSQVIQGLPRLGAFVNPGFMPVTRAEDNSKLDDAGTLANLSRMQPGDVAYGYVNAHSPFTDILSRPGWATLFVYRDPRDVIISHVFYATQMHEDHALHQYYTLTLKTMEERIEAAIRGVEQPGAELSSIRQKFGNYLGWLELSEVLCLRFEELILEREAALRRFLDYLQGRGFVPQLPRQQEILILQQAITPRKSGTFRKGQPGGWKEYFTERNKALFKELAGDLLVLLGYEKDQSW